jgi:splicing factor 1
MIMGESEDRVTAAVRLINSIIEESCSIPEGQNELKKQQLRELALLNGTLRDDEGNLCGMYVSWSSSAWHHLIHSILDSCNQPGHRRFECPERTNVTNKMLCRICGGVGHMAQDCLQKNDPEALKRAMERNQAMDSEYNKLMRELDGSGSAQDAEGADRSEGGGGGASGGPAGPVQPANSVPPWRRQSQQGQQMQQQMPGQQSYGMGAQGWPQQGAWPVADSAAAAAMGSYDMSAYYGQDAQQQQQMYMDPAYAAWAQQQWAQQGYAGYGQQ